MNLLEAARACSALGFEKPGGAKSYWSDVRLLLEEGGLLFFAHARGMAFHYPKRGVLRPCTIPCVVVLDPLSCVCGYLMKKARIFDLVPEALEEEARRPTPCFEDFAVLPASLYLNVCEPGVFRYDAPSRTLFLTDMYLDVVKNVVAADVAMVQVEREIHASLLRRGRLIEARDLRLGPSAGPNGARTVRVEEFRAEIVDEAELEAARQCGVVSAQQAAQATDLARDLLERVEARAFPYDEPTLDRLLRAAFESAPEI